MKMIDIGEKKVTLREAIVEGKITLKPKIIELIKKNKIPKGNVLEAAKIAGILAAKKTPEIIPLCHPIPIEFMAVDISLGKNEIKIKATVRGEAKTGVEMEAFTAVAVSALTIYDMCKALDREMVIKEIKLIKKSGGKTGDYYRDARR